MSKEQIPAPTIEEAELNVRAESKESRKESQGLLRRLILSGSLLLNAGFLGEAAVSKYEASTLGSEEGKRFQIYNPDTSEKGTFKAYRAPNGEYILYGEIQTEEGEKREVFFNMSDKKDPLAEIKKIEKSKNPTEALHLLLDTASSGRIRINTPDGLTSYEANFSTVSGASETINEPYEHPIRGKEMSIKAFRENKTLGQLRAELFAGHNPEKEPPPYDKDAVTGM